MLTTFFKSQPTLRRLRTGAAGEFIDDYAQSLRDAGYASRTACTLLRTAGHLSRWLGDHGPRLRDWDERALQRFWQHLDTCKCGRVNEGKFPSATEGARRFLAYLRQRAVVQTHPPVKQGPRFELVVAFQSWLRQHRGVSAATLERYSGQVAPYLSAVGGRIDRITAATLRKFVLRKAARGGRNRAQCAAGALRAFVRFLVCVGKVSPALEAAIPAIRKWRLAALPAFLSGGEIDRVVAACDDSSSVGARDRAVILLLARLGLRAGDVAALRLKSIDFATASISVDGKARREVRLPLTQEVGDAITRYLTFARPEVKCDRLFIRVEAPLGPLTRGAVKHIATSAIRRAGVRTARFGAHVLRYSAATAMLREGATLVEIGAVLRHRSPDMTGHYAKIDINLLRRVVQPWPEVRPC